MAKELKIEEALKRLGEIVNLLENNESSLEEALKQFEEGIALVRGCHSKLSEVEKKIEILTQVTEDGVRTKPL